MTACKLSVLIELVLNILSLQNYVPNLNPRERDNLYRESDGWKRIRRHGKEVRITSYLILLETLGTKVIKG